MTLFDLGRLMRRYLWLVVGLPVVCVALCGIVLFAAPSSSAGGGSASAVSRLIVNSQVQSVAGLAASEARQASMETPGVSAETKADAATMTVTITVNGTDGQLCAQVANQIADDTAEAAEGFYADSASPDGAVSFAVQIEHVDPASVAVSASSDGGKGKYLLVALLAGLFVAVCVLVVVDIARRPVKSIEGVQDAVELPVLEKLPIADGGERLLANVRFASKVDKLESVCVIPVSTEASVEEVATALEAAASAEGTQLNAVRCQSFAHGMSAAYAAQDADAAVLIVNQWSDSLKTLESAVAELQLADTNLVGLVFGKEVKKSK